MLLTDACNENDDWAKHIPVWIQASFLMAGVWALGGTLSSEFREAFDQFYRDIWKGYILYPVAYYHLNSFISHFHFLVFSLLGYKESEGCTAVPQ